MYFVELCASTGSGGMKWSAEMYLILCLVDIYDFLILAFTTTTVDSR